MINLLVIDNADRLSSALKYLDPFPDSSKLAQAKRAQNLAKYGGGDFNLMEVNQSSPKNENTFSLLQPKSLAVK